MVIGAPDAALVGSSAVIVGAPTDPAIVKMTEATTAPEASRN